ncbi:MAG: Rdx family protein [Thermomicrobiales bacterium]|nr:Rdx family protein [Thermomicrobiales bacterium]
MAENLLHDYGEDLPGGLTLLPGRVGAFEVSLDGELLYSKFATERFPDANEVEKTVGDRLDEESADEG